VKRSTTRGGGARTAALVALAAEPFDLLVIGAGITGAGIARDAALRGLRTALVERDDFGSGTSSRSSRLVHGGVRYLEYGYFHLVFEASRERRILLRIAPHLVHPLAFTWPVYRGARLQRWKLGAGLLLYDSLALFRNVARHRRLTAADLLAREPGLRTDDLVGGAVYFDAATDDSRLTLTNALSAVAAGAVVANHTAVDGIEHDANGRATGAAIRDGLTGATCLARAHVIVNAAGPWGDAVRRLDEPAGEAAAVHGTKGVHLAVPAARVGNAGAVTLISPVDARVMFVLPAGAFTIIGTTDTETTASPDTVRADTSDIAYLLESVNAMFPAAHLSRADVVSAWAGIRPLVATGNAGDPASASREHAIVTGPSGMITVSGGKLTTYRAMAAEVVGVVETALGRAITPTRTAIDHLPGWDRAAAVADLAAPNASLSGALVPGLRYTGADLVYGAQSEMACTLADLLIRRTHIAFETRDAGIGVAPLAADIVARTLGWDADERRRQVDDYTKEAARIFAVDP
jgi:glycerol-3-phosphate dehydrogenase